MIVAHARAPRRARLGTWPKRSESRKTPWLKHAQKYSPFGFWRSRWTIGAEHPGAARGHDDLPVLSRQEPAVLLALPRATTILPVDGPQGRSALRTG